MNDRNLTQKKKGLEDEVVDMLMEDFEKQSSDQEMRKLVEKGDFSNKDFEWLMEWTKLPPNERRAMNVSDRQHKLRARRTVIKAVATLAWAHYLMDAFTDEEWEEIIPSKVLSRMAYFSALRGGYENALNVSIGLDSGLNAWLKAEASSTVKAEVRLTLIPSAEQLTKVQSEVGRRLVARMRERKIKG